MCKSLNQSVEVTIRLGSKPFDCQGPFGLNLIEIPEKTSFVIKNDDRLFELMSDLNLCIQVKIRRYRDL